MIETATREGPTRFSPSPFRAHPLLANQHIQTIYGTIVPRRLPGFQAWRAASEERVYTLADGDRLKGVAHMQAARDAERPMLLLLHGLEGSADAHYVRGLSAKAFAAGYDSLRLNFRSCGGTEALSRRLYHGGMIDDVAQVLEALRTEGHRRVYLVGVSLGANLLLRRLAEDGEEAHAHVAGAVAVSAPIDLVLTERAIARPENFIYTHHFLTSLRETLRRKIAAHPDVPELGAWLDQARKADSLGAFDALVTAPSAGFADRDAYYAHAGTGDRLAAIRVPTLLIHAQDDPFVPFEMYRAREAIIANNPCLQTLYPRQGGHVGFLGLDAGREASWMDGYWAENQAIAFVAWVEAARKQAG